MQSLGGDFIYTVKNLNLFYHEVIFSSELYQ